MPAGGLDPAEAEEGLEDEGEEEEEEEDTATTLVKFPLQQLDTKIVLRPPGGTHGVYWVAK